MLLARRVMKIGASDLQPSSNQEMQKRGTQTVTSPLNTITVIIYRSKYTLILIFILWIWQTFTFSVHMIPHTNCPCDMGHNIWVISPKTSEVEPINRLGSTELWNQTQHKGRFFGDLTINMVEKSCWARWKFSFVSSYSDNRT